MLVAKKKTVKKSGTRRPGPPQNEVEKLAQKLVTWAGKLPKTQQELLVRLLARAKSGKLPRGATCETELTVEEAVRDALASFGSLNLPGWQHSIWKRGPRWVNGPLWPKGPLWQRGR
jgi:hypothetical protein